MRALLNLFKKSAGRRSGRMARKPTSKPEKPKNGFLILGIISTIIVMAGLTVFNMRLLREQAPMRYLPVRDALPEQTLSVIPERVESASNQEEKKHCSPTEVTFYQKLKTQEDKVHPENSNQKPVPPYSEIGLSKKNSNRQNPDSIKEENEFSVAALSGIPKPSLSERNVGLPKGSPGQKVYSVQVGVFSHPRIAQEWAEKWKSKGYPATLRPIARPSSGVQYRLFLGEFNSEQNADEFAKQLKAKEGVTGMTLVIKD
ncbi:MAG: SPOR domain-containing protein [Pseudomonadota bacterium]